MRTRSTTPSKVFAPIGILDRTTLPQTLLDLLDATEIVGAGRSSCDERDAGTPYRFICRQTVSDSLHAGDRAEQRHRAIQHAQGTLDLNREVDVAGSMMLMRCSGKVLSIPFQKQVVAADVIVMPRSCSCSCSPLRLRRRGLRHLVRDAV